ncbi:MAG: glycosyltransferase family 2 protein [Lachnospiraceae bacterium]|jgi:hypothetical protein|nr:glycosyltransferase family 2 protein [Lachnospiraceae bacterium]
MKDFHTFAICAYGDSPYLEACIRSVTMQSCPTNVILCTSTPSPYIKKLAKAYQIPVLIREGKKGIGEDWNFAYEMADSRYVTIAHQDDMYGKHYVEELKQAVGRFPDISLFTTDYVTVKNRKLAKGERLEGVKRFLRIPLRIPSLNHLSVIKKASLCFGNPICCPACTYRKEEGFQENRPFFNPSFRFVLDWDRLIAMAKEPGRFICAEKPLVYHRLHPDAATNSCMKEHLRFEEESKMFALLWPDCIVRLIMKFYQRAYDSYEISG